jgi:hypothetical protein
MVTDFFFNTFGFNKHYFTLCLYHLFCCISPPFNSLLGGGKEPSSEPPGGINAMRIILLLPSGSD